MSHAGRALDSVNRLVGSVLGVLLVVVGGFGLARSLGGFGADAGAGLLVPQDLRAEMVVYAGWVAGGAAFVALLVAWMGWRWLRLQLVPTPPMRRVTVGTSHGQGGSTSVDAGALAEAVTRDLAESDHVASARSRVVGQDGAPALALTAEVAVGGDPQAVRTHVAEHVLPRARAALGRDDLAAHLHLRLSDPKVRSLD